MRVCIYTGNHGNAVGLSDLVRLLRNSIADCGWDVCVSHELMRGCCNILIEHFVEEPVLRHVLESKTPGTRYVLIGTELITGKTFNRGLVQQHWHYGNDPYWQTRYEGFMFVARLADVVWVLGEPAIAPYQAALPDKPVRFMPHGWVSDFELVRHRPEAEKDIDFHFSGTLTAYRREILEALVATRPPRRLQRPEHARLPAPRPARPHQGLPVAAALARQRAALDFAHALPPAEPQFPDPGTVFRLLLARPVRDARVACRRARVGKRRARDPNRREIADGVWQRFKTEMPMTRWMQPLMAEAIGQATAPAREAIRQVA